MGGRRLSFVSADRILLPEAISSPGREKSIHHQPNRRLRFPARNVPADQALWDIGLRQGFQRNLWTARRNRGWHAHSDGAADDGGSYRQVGADSTLRLVTRCDGRPHSRFGADSRRDHGDGGYIHDRALEHSVSACSHSHARSCDHRCVDCDLRSQYWPGSKRHQTCSCLLYRFAAGLHVHGLRSGSVLCRHLSPHDSRLL